ncbi:conserved hypothetical protein [Verticillium alfalfae VaMs.102]|uniref:Uncharacterized protein n=1 Tax=Verticillium alfalfae (strain VaMs.102 / ATCC MYA-4576 / FGSC 10136) TaxID=526221 RepID=C9SN59_VERA1|nr:conserved hypothetical protein [Verticillium alfalfae VaMs.102]EEY20224.1 conserved hypothetical protein [Verticillium alfalfae VaMs.102]
MTTDYFAQILVQDLDLPNRQQVVSEISKQIRTQLEEYAGVALHPLFHTQPSNNLPAGTPKPLLLNRDDSATATPFRPRDEQCQGPADVTAAATPITAESEDYNPDDTYRCIVNLNINLSSTLYTDKFEWSLLHPPGTAEAFAKQTCADLGLAGEWVAAMTHAIYEAVLRLKKEACEAGGLVGGWGAQSEIANDAAHGAEAGWRYDPESLADEWEPKIEILTKEDIEKREGDRERQIRRLRRETARFSSTTGLVGGIPFSGFGGIVDVEEERMGRGERSKKKKRFRSLSPLGRSGTPGGRGTPDTGAGYGGGGGGTLTDQERLAWKCYHCHMPGTSVWAVRDGPTAPRYSCHCIHLWLYYSYDIDASGRRSSAHWARAHVPIRPLIHVQTCRGHFLVILLQRHVNSRLPSLIELAHLRNCSSTITLTQGTFKLAWQHAKATAISFGSFLDAPGVPCTYRYPAVTPQPPRSQIGT